MLNIWDRDIRVNDVVLGARADSLPDPYRCVAVDWQDRSFEDWCHEADAIDLTVIDGIVIRISSSESFWVDGAGETIGATLSEVTEMIGETPEIEVVDGDQLIAEFPRSRYSCFVLFGRVMSASIDDPDLIQD